MQATLLDGKLVSAALLEKLTLRADALRARGITPKLTVVLVGEDPASQIYVRNKEKGCAQVGIVSEVVRLPAEIPQEILETQVRALNADETVHGILVQLPLPVSLNEQAVLSLIDPGKDVDGFHAINVGRLTSALPGFVPCTPKGCMALLDHYGIPVAGKHAVVVGRSNIVGKPMALLLLQRNATVTICHSYTVDVAAQCRTADILVAALGKPRFITADMVKPGATVLDVGINRVDGKVVGDVDFDAVREVAGAITPVPGGVGRMTIAMLLSNALDAAERSMA